MGRPAWAMRQRALVQQSVRSDPPPTRVGRMRHAPCGERAATGSRQLLVVDGARDAKKALANLRGGRYPGPRNGFNQNQNPQRSSLTRTVHPTLTTPTSIRAPGLV
eukprot:scaffold132040_cov57-Phaeocystis_antarctica.AAC.2